MSETIDIKVPGTRNRVPVRTTGQWRSRFLGLAGARELKKSCGVWVKRCSSINTFGFAQPVDVVFLSADGVVTKVVAGMKPWRMSSCPEARTVLELRAGLASRLNLAPGVVVTAAIQGLNMREFQGRNLTVNEAKPREDRGGSGGGGRRY